MCLLDWTTKSIDKNLSCTEYQAVLIHWKTGSTAAVPCHLALPSEMEQCQCESLLNLPSYSEVFNTCKLYNVYHSGVHYHGLLMYVRSTLVTCHCIYFQLILLTMEKCRLTK